MSNQYVLIMDNSGKAAMVDTLRNPFDAENCMAIASTPWRRVLSARQRDYKTPFQNQIAAGTYLYTSGRDTVMAAPANGDFLPPHDKVSKNVDSMLSNAYVNRKIVRRTEWIPRTGNLINPGLLSGRARTILYRGTDCLEIPGWSIASNTLSDSYYTYLNMNCHGISLEGEGDDMTATVSQTINAALLAGRTSIRVKSVNSVRTAVDNFVISDQEPDSEGYYTYTPDAPFSDNVEIVFTITNAPFHSPEVV